MAIIWLSEKRDFFIKISSIFWGENSTYDEYYFQGGLPNERIQDQAYHYIFDKIKGLSQVTLDVDSTVITRNDEQQGACRGYKPNRSGRSSHNPLLAFVAEARMVANFWL